MMAGVDLVRAEPRQMQAQADLLSDRVQVLFDRSLSSLGYIRRAVTCARAHQRSLNPLLPERSLVGGTVPGYEVDGWLSVGAGRTPPKSSPRSSTSMTDSPILSSVEAGRARLVPTQMTAAPEPVRR